MTDNRLSDDLNDAIDDALLTGTPVSKSDAFHIAEVFRVWAETPEQTRANIAAKYDHPVVGPTGRRALDALNAFLLTLESDDES